MNNTATYIEPPIKDHKELSNVGTKTHTEIDDAVVIVEAIPVNPVYTDTVYTHPLTHPATIVTQDSSHRFITDAERAKWDALDVILPYIKSDGTISEETDIQGAFELQETKTIFGGNF